MSVYYSDDQVTLLLGDALEQLATLPAGSVDCIVTSPPYYSLRDYDVDGQYGLEATPGEYVETMRALFAEARRVLADTGTLWLNLGDTYYSGKGASTGLDRRQKARRGFARPVDRSGLGYPRKSLLMIPARVAIALQEDGWTLRSEIVWDRIDPLPEVAADRPARRTERLYLFAKQPRYSYDRTAPGAGIDVWHIRPDRSTASNGHVAPFPVELPMRCIQAGRQPSGTVLDPFSGSGTTGAAALLLGRKYIGIDLSATYHDQAIEQRFAQGAFDFTHDDAA
ncbi:DNA-methyltransferase [Streptomyces sp. NPDC002758]